MKKAIIPITIIAALLVAFMGLSASAAQGWTRENGSWVYYDDEGSRAEDVWRLGADGSYYYLDTNGEIVTSSFIDDRYVDSDGRMITSAWRQIDGEWYYFDANGKMVQNTKRQVSGKYYYFDSDGSMITGWIQYNDEWYYCDPSDGHMIAGAWALLTPSTEMYEDAIMSSYDGLYSSVSLGTYWFYFRSNGTIVRATEGSYYEYMIGDERYAFDAMGRMCVGWIKLNDDENVPAIANYKYYNDDVSLGAYGAAHVGWLSAYPPTEAGADLGTGGVVWYYFNSRGEPYYSVDADVSRDVEVLRGDLKRITKDGETNTYLFNEYGNPVYGLRKVIRGGKEVIMYFGTKDQSCVQYGLVTVTESDDTTSSYYFDSSGNGYTGVHNGKLYYKGKLQKAIGQSRTYIEIEKDEKDYTYLVSSTGNILRNYNSRAKGIVEYKSDSSGLDSGGTAADFAEEPQEPEYERS